MHDKSTWLSQQMWKKHLKNPTPLYDKPISQLEIEWNSHSQRKDICKKKKHPQLT